METNTTNKTLMVNKRDFLVIYFSSLISLLLIFLVTHFVQKNGVPISEYLYLIPGAAISALFPPLAAKFISSGRIVVQIMFGAMLCPFIAAIIINIMPLFTK